MRFRQNLFLSIAAIFLFAGSALAQSQITLDSSIQGITFHQNGGIDLGLCTGTTCALGGGAYYDAQPGLIGQYLFKTTLNGGGLTYQESSSGAPQYLLNSNLATTTFTLVMGTDEWLTANVRWTYLVDSSSPELDATLTDLNVSEVASDSFKALFRNRGAALLDMAINDPMNCSNLAKGQNCTVTGISKSGSTAIGEGNVLHGEIIPAPEPASLALLGSGLLVIGGTVRRRLKK